MPVTQCTNHKPRKAKWCIHCGGLHPRKQGDGGVMAPDVPCPVYVVREGDEKKGRPTLFRRDRIHVKDERTGAVLLDKPGRGD